MREALHKKLDEILVRVTRIEALLIQEGRFIMSTQAEIQAAIDADIQAVAKNTSAVQSAVALMNGINQRIADAIAAFQAANPGVDVSGLTAANATLAANAQALADAVVANTPAAPPSPTP